MFYADSSIDLTCFRYSYWFRTHNNHRNLRIRSTPTSILFHVLISPFQSYERNKSCLWFVNLNLWHEAGARKHRVHWAELIPPSLDNRHNVLRNRHHVAYKLTYIRINPSLCTHTFVCSHYIWVSIDSNVRTSKNAWTYWLRHCGSRMVPVPSPDKGGGDVKGLAAVRCR